MTIPDFMTGHHRVATLIPPGVFAALRDYREAAGLSGASLASASGLSQSFISELENGRKRITHETLSKLAAGYSITPTALLAELQNLLNQRQSAPPDPATSSMVAEAPAAYRTNGTPTLSQDCEKLARWFVGRMSRQESYQLIHKLATEAENGNHHASASARALLYILDSQS